METHRDPLAEDHQDPLEDAHQVDPLEADHRVGEDPLDRADLAEALLEDPLEDAHQVDPLEADHRVGEDPLDRADLAEALLEDPLGTPTSHQGTATRMQPGGGLSISAGGSSPSSAR